MRVLVVGGGIGGLSAAIALRQREVDVDIVEINPRWDVYGVGIIQPGNAIRALDALGLAEQAVAQGYAMKGSRFHDSQGNLLGEVPALDLLGPRYPAMNGLTRPKLHALFQEAVKASGADVRLGMTVDRVGEDGGVELSDGSAGEYDLIVGADGIHSKVREPRLPGRARARVHGADRVALQRAAARGSRDAGHVRRREREGRVRAARAGPDVHPLHRGRAARGREDARRQARGDLPRAARRVRRPGRRGARPLHHRSGEGRRATGRVAARPEAVAPRPRRPDRRRGACDLPARRPGRRDGDGGRDRARRGGDDDGRRGGARAVCRSGGTRAAARSGRSPGRSGPGRSSTRRLRKPTSSG